MGSKKNFFQKYNFINKKSKSSKYLNRSSNLKKLQPLTKNNRSISSKNIYSLRNLKKDYIKEKLQKSKKIETRKNLKKEINKYFKHDLKIKKIIKENFEDLKNKKILDKNFFEIILNLKSENKEDLKINFFCDLNFFSRNFFESFGKNLFSFIDKRNLFINVQYGKILKYLITCEICVKIENEENEKIYDYFLKNKNFGKLIKEKREKKFIENESEKK